MKRYKRSFTIIIILLLALVSAGIHPVSSFNSQLCKSNIVQSHQSECCCGQEISLKDNCSEETKNNSEKPAASRQYTKHNSACDCHISPASSVPVNPKKTAQTFVQKPSFQQLFSVFNKEYYRFQNQSNPILKLYVSSIPASLSTLLVGNVCLRI